MFSFAKKSFFKKNKNNLQFSNTKYCDDFIAAQANKLNLTSEELKKIWIEDYFSKIEQSYKKELENKFVQMQQEYNTKITKLIVNAFNRLDYQYFRDEFIVKIPFKNNEIKNRLIGLNGRNKKTFERTCGVELIVKDNDDNIYLSSANRIKRQIAYQVLTRILEIKNIEPNKIENYYKEECENFEKNLFSIGEETVKKMRFNHLNPKLYPYIGKMRYRYSFGQNVLEHSIECAMLAEMVAKELKLNPYKAKLAAFFHDLGKSVDHDVGKDHITLGLEIAVKFGLPDYVISAIKTHHDTNISHNLYDALVKIVDKASAARPGARNNTKENFFKRAEIYENILKKFNEVQNVWVLQSGFVIKVLLKPNSISDSEIKYLIQRMKLALEENEFIKDYVVSVEIIKEDVFSFKTEKLTK